MAEGGDGKVPRKKKKQKRKVIVLLCFTVTAYHRGLSVLSLCSKSVL